MKYTLFDTLSGVVTDRHPLLLESGEILLLFAGAPDNSTVLVKSESGHCWYRDIVDGRCYIPVIPGHLSVWVKHFDKQVTTWECEGLCITSLGEGRTLVLPDDTNLPKEMARLYVENQNIRDEQKSIKEELAKLRERLEKMLEGWNIT